MSIVSTLQLHYINIETIASELQKGMQLLNALEDIDWAAEKLLHGNRALSGSDGK